MIVVALLQIELREDRAHVLLDGPLGNHEPLANPLVGAAFGNQFHHLALARRQRVDGIICVAPVPEQLRDDGRVERRAALGDSLQSGREVLKIGDAVLEQVTDTGRRLSKEARRDTDLHVLGQNQNPHPGIATADFLGRAQTFVRVRRGHPDVDDRHIRLRIGDYGQEVVGAAGLGDDVDAGVAEQGREAVADQQVVVGNYDAHGITAVTVVPRPAGLTTARRPSSASTRSARPRSPEPLASSAPPIPSSVTSTNAAAPSRDTRTSTADARAYLAIFVIDSATTK